jgi:hypothetical protein
MVKGVQKRLANGQRPPAHVQPRSSLWRLGKLWPDEEGQERAAGYGALAGDAWACGRIEPAGLGVEPVTVETVIILFLDDGEDG